MVPETDRVVTFDLKRYNLMARIWSALPSIINRNVSADTADDAPALVAHRFGDDVLIYSLARNLKLRVWSFKDQKCLMETNIVDFAIGRAAVNMHLNTTLDVNSSFSASLNGGANNQTNQGPQAAARPILRAVRNESSGHGSITVAAYLEYDKEPQFILFRPLVIENVVGQIKLECLARMGSPPFDDLIDFALTTRDNELWAVGTDSSLDSSSPYAIYHQSYDPTSSRSARSRAKDDDESSEPGGTKRTADEDNSDDDNDADFMDSSDDGWTICFIEQMITTDIMTNIIGIKAAPRMASSEVSAGDKYISDIFCKGNFALHTISRAIRAYAKQYHASVNLPDFTHLDLANADPTAMMEQIVQEAQRLVELTVERKSLSANVQRTPEEMDQIYTNEWSKIQRSCYQCRDVENRVKGLFVVNPPATASATAVDRMYGHVSLVKQCNVSFSRPVGPPFEQLILATDPADIKHHLERLRTSQTRPRLPKRVIASLDSVFQAVALISARLDPTCNEEFEAAFFGQNSAQLTPAEWADYLAGQVLALDVDTENVPLKYHLNDLFEGAGGAEIIAALDFCLTQLDLVLRDKQQATLSATANSLSRSIGPMSSSLGLLVLVETVKHQVRLRFNFGRLLLLLQYLLVSLRNSSLDSGSSKSSSKIETIQMHVIPRTINICTHYHYLTWVCELYPLGSLGGGDFAEHYTATAHLAFSELTSHLKWAGERVKWISADQLTPFHPLFIPKSLLFNFLRERGLSLAQTLLAADRAAHDVTDLPAAILQVLWPVNPFNYLLEYLFVVGQFHPLLVAIQLLERQSTPLIEHSQSTLAFMFGVCQLMADSPHEAAQSFVTAVRGVQRDQLMALLLQLGHDPSAGQVVSRMSADVIYSFFNKIIQVFRCYKLNEQIIELANAALGYIQGLPRREPQSLDDLEPIDTPRDYTKDYLSSLFTTLFMCHLELDAPADAHLAMTFIPDLPQRRVCLRQFIVYHHDNNRWASLIGDFSLAGDMVRDFISIMEQRARSTDLSESVPFIQESMMDSKSSGNTKPIPSYYEILYALHVKSSNFHRAATMSYELATRISQELTTSKAVLEKQMSALQMTINALDLLEDPDLRCLISSVNSAEVEAVHAEFERANQTVAYRHGQLMDTDQDGALAVAPLVDVSPPAVTLEDIKLEYELVSARLALLDRQLTSGGGALRGNSIAMSQLSPSELLTLLVGSALYDTAFRIIAKFYGSSSSTASAKREQVFDGLSSKYLTALVGRVSLEEIQEIILDNRSLRTSHIATCHAATAATRLWMVVEHYLAAWEDPGQTFAHKSVAKRLLGAGHAPLPASLVATYKRRNWIELLRLYLTHGLLEEAVTLVSEFLDALNYGAESAATGGVLSKDEEHFALARPLNPFAPPTNVPLHLVKELRILLTRQQADTEDMQREKDLSQLIASLDGRLATFYTTAQQVSVARLNSY